MGRWVTPFLLIAMLIFAASTKVEAACGHYLTLSGPPTPKNPKRGPVQNENASPASHSKKIEEALRKGKNIEGLVKIYDRPLPLDFMFEIYAESYPRGEEYGALWHIRPRDTAKALIAAEGNNYVKLETEYDEKTSGFFDFFHRSVAQDGKIGEYWTARESPELFDTLKREWNERHFWSDREIVVNVRTTGADRQMPMARLRAENTPVIGVATPHIPVSYIVTASGIPNIENPDLAIDPATGRVTQYSSLATHDWRELDSAIWISPYVARRMRDTSRVWLEIHDMLKKSNLMATDAKTIELSQKFRDFASKEAEKSSVALNSGKGFTEEGAAWWRLAEIEIYRSQRVFHSYNHLLSELLRRPKGIPHDTVVSRYGPIHEREFPMHLSALGIAAGKAPPHLSPLVKLTYEEGTLKGPLTLEKAIDRVLNNERKRLEDFAKRVPDKNVKELIKNFLLEFPDFDKYWIQDEANDQRRRFEAMGQNIDD